MLLQSVKPRIYVKLTYLPDHSSFPNFRVNFYHGAFAHELCLDDGANLNDDIVFNSNLALTCRWTLRANVAALADDTPAADCDGAIYSDNFRTGVDDCVTTNRYQVCARQLGMISDDNT